MFCTAWGEFSDVTKEQISPTSRAQAEGLDSSLQDVICKTVEMGVLRMVFNDFWTTWRQNDPQKLCARLTLKAIEYVANDGRGLYTFRFVVNEGDPPRVFDAKFAFASHFARSVENLHVVQVTRYRKYQACTPPNVPAEICVC